MKLNTALFSLLVGGLLFAGCSSDDDNAVINGNTPNEQIVKAFKQQYPNATNVKWSTRDSYAVASFSLTQSKAKDINEAWYEQNGVCALSEIEITFDELPTAVKESYNTTSYATEGWEIDDIDKLSRNGMALVYKIEVEKAGQPDHDLLFSETGLLISDKIDNDTDDDNENVPVVIPGAILDFINAHLNGATILDYDTDNGEKGVELTYKNKEVELYFSNANAFLRSEDEITEDELPEAVSNALQKEIAGWEIDDITRITYADKQVIYEVELDNLVNDDEKTLRFNSDGTLLI